MSEQRFDALIIDFDNASSGPGFDLAKLLSLFLLVPNIALLLAFVPDVAVQSGTQDSLVKSDLTSKWSSDAALRRDRPCHSDTGFFDCGGNNLYQAAFAEIPG